MERAALRGPSDPALAEQRVTMRSHEKSYGKRGKWRKKTKQEEKNTGKARENKSRVRDPGEHGERGLMYNSWRIHEKKMNKAPGDLER